MTMMPCYDKKLEASRSDFYNDLYRTRDVDCVVTSGVLTTCSVIYIFNKAQAADCHHADTELTDCQSCFFFLIESASYISFS